MLGGLGRRDKEPMNMLNSPADLAKDAHLTCVFAPVLQFFMNNHLSETPTVFQMLGPGATPIYIKNF